MYRNTAILAVPLAVVPTALDLEFRMTANPAPAGRQMPLRFSSKELSLLLTKPTAGKSRKGTRRVAPWTAGTCPRFSMRSLLSRISGALRPSSKRSEYSAHPEEGARLSKLRLRKAVTSHTQSTGFASHCVPFTPCARFRWDRLERTRTKIGMSNHSCNVSQNISGIVLDAIFRLAARRTTHDFGVALGATAVEERAKAGQFRVPGTACL